ncbi:hypothetical protein BGX31_000748 [Mortierella sp. GBA43]|nr:hypothetical protein BGX31_000748 [Mortierella sp. GBA43]
MIQCETCKVWQHCPCVGLGDGEITPDKYYCECCRPDIHPYKILNGQLVSNSQKPTKKRSTMNSKEASIPMDLMLAQQKWNEEHQEELEEEFALRTSSKRRRKTESSSVDLNDDILKAHDSSKGKETEPSPRSTGDKKDKSGRQASSEHDVATTSPGSSPSAAHNGRAGSKKSPAAKTTSKSRSRSNSPKVNGSDDSSRPHNHEPAHSRTGSDDETKRVAAEDDLNTSSKRRKPHASSMDGDDDEWSKDSTEDSSKSRKTGNASRQGSKRNANYDEQDFSPFDMTSISSPPLHSKKSFSKRGGDRGHRNGSRPSTPTPNSEGTPQPMAPAPPAAVRYPSSKMTIQEMTRRAKQLLDYISRVQIDMADRKSKSGSASPVEDASAGEVHKSPCRSASVGLDHAHPQADSELKESSLFCLPPPSVSVASIHDDSQVCPDLSRSSMDSTASSVESLHEPSSPQDAKFPIKELSSDKEMTIRVVPMNGRDPVPLLSTPPLSVHDHHDHHDHHQHHQHRRHASGTPESETAHEPLTPPPSSETHDDQQPQPRHEKALHSLSTSTAGFDQGKQEPTSITSLELMDKLTGDLIRFQERFGGCV